MLLFHELDSKNLYTLFEGGHRDADRAAARRACKKYINDENLTPTEQKYHQEAKRRYYLPGKEGGTPHQAKYNNNTYRQFLDITNESHSEKAHCDGGRAFNNTRRESSDHNQKRGLAYAKYSQQQANAFQNNGNLIKKKPQFAGITCKLMQF
jgi:hypothetical protein